MSRARRLCAAAGPFADTMRALDAEGEPDLLSALTAMLTPYQEFSDALLRGIAEQPDDRWFGVVSPAMARSVIAGRAAVAKATDRQGEV